MKKEDGRRKKDEGRRKKEAGSRKMEEGKRKKEEGRRKNKTVPKTKPKGARGNRWGTAREPVRNQ